MIITSPDPPVRSIDDNVQLVGSVVILLRDLAGNILDAQVVRNIVTDAGDLYYAQKVDAETPTNVFGILELGTAGAAPGKTSNRSAISAYAAGSQKAFDTGYPKRNDTDAANTGKAVDARTYKVTYGTTEANVASMERGIITNASPGASEPVMAYFTFAAVTKTSANTLVVYLNHTFNGT